MREIKLRIWDKEKEKMIYFDNIFSMTRPYTETSSLPQYESFPKYHEIEIMQYTGIKDKNDKEIYEGDILNDHTWWWGPRFVYLDVGQCGGCKGDSVMSYILALNVKEPYKNCTYNTWNGREVNVIGNIFENENLLVNFGPSGEIIK